MNPSTFSAYAFVALIFSVGWFVGDIAAHITVSRECERLGAFYVGERVFRCEEKP